MATWIVIMLFSAGAVLLFVVGMSLTLIFKGHHIDSEIATNRHMRQRGITCAAADARVNLNGARRHAAPPDCHHSDATDPNLPACGDHDCAACAK